VSRKLDRRQLPYIGQDLEKKMVLVAGPRQCGKTTLAKKLLATMRGAHYSWDVARDRMKLRRQELDEDARLWIFDELHKGRAWRNWLKGVFDEHHDQHPILVTGSARLDIYSRGGDSLQGRYYKHRMHPVTLSEFLGLAAPSTLDNIISAIVSSRQITGRASTLADLANLGGFPEPLLSGSDLEARRWRLAYGELLIREDIRTLESIRDLDRMELLFERLPTCVGSVLSINSLREDLEVAFETVRHWLSVLEHTYAVFRLPPFGAPRIKAVKKEQKLYCWDWSRVEVPGPRFENLVAVHLLRLIHFAEDVYGEKLELRYFRDTVGHEVDFVVIRKHSPWFVVECKVQSRGLDPNLKYLLERVSVPYAFQVSAENGPHFRLPAVNGCEVHILPAATLLAALP